MSFYAGRLNMALPGTAMRCGMLRPEGRHLSFLGTPRRSFRPSLGSPVVSDPSEHHALAKAPPPLFEGANTLHAKAGAYTEVDDEFLWDYKASGLLLWPSGRKNQLGKKSIRDASISVCVYQKGMQTDNSVLF